MISRLCMIKMLDEVVYLFEEMHFKSMIPDTVNYNSFVNGLCKSRILTYAWKLVDRCMIEDTSRCNHLQFFHKCFLQKPSNW